MGLAKAAAEIVKRRLKKDKNTSENQEEAIDNKSLSSGSPYRVAPLQVYDLSRSDLEQVLHGLIDKGLVSAEDVNSQVDKVRDDVKIKLNNAARVDGLLNEQQKNVLLTKVKARLNPSFAKKNGIEWAKVQERLEANPEKLWSLNEMERTGGEPEVVRFNKKTNEYTFMDCSKESPAGRRLVCYDRAAQESAEYLGYRVNGNAVDMAREMGIELLSESDYHFFLQEMGRFDLDSLSWLRTPDGIREEGEALIGTLKNIPKTPSYITGLRLLRFEATSRAENIGFRGKLVV